MLLELLYAHLGLIFKRLKIKSEMTNYYFWLLFHERQTVCPVSRQQLQFSFLWKNSVSPCSCCAFRWMQLNVSCVFILIGSALTLNTKHNARPFFELSSQWSKCTVNLYVLPGSVPFLWFFWTVLMGLCFCRWGISVWSWRCQSCRRWPRGSSSKSKLSSRCSLQR